MSLLASSKFHLLPPVSPPPLPPLPFSSTLFYNPPPFFSHHTSHTRKSCLPVSVLPSRDLDILPPWVFLFPLSLSLSIFPVKYASPSRSTSRHSYPSVHLLCRVKYTSALEESAGRGFWRGSTGIWLSSSLGRGAQTFFYFGVFSSQSAAFIVLSHTAVRRCTR